MKNYVYCLLGIVLAAVLFTMGWNYIFDTSGLFQQDFSKKRIEPNQHFVKVRYILENPEKYDAFCFGSSRVGNIDLLKINNGMRYYNMTYSEGLPAEWLSDLEIFLRHGVSVKQVMIGLDEFSFRVAPDTHKAQWLRIPYTEDDKVKAYLSYLLKKPEKPVKVGDKGSIYDIYDSGRPLHPEPDAEIEANVERHLNDEKFTKPVGYQGNRIEKTMAELAALKTLCEKNNIELIVFINPINAVTYRSTNLSEFNDFKRQLAALTDYYDFSGLNEITTNNYYYYETSHYRPLVGDKIVNRIFHQDSSDFGELVTKDTVETHIRRLEAQVG